jgi:3-methyladenine DNA glycosylase AlkD
MGNGKRKSLHCSIKTNYNIIDMTVQELRKQIKNQGTQKRAKANAWFFKTGPGEYGEGDKFLGLTMGEQRVIAKSYVGLELDDLIPLLKSSWHEERMVGLLVLTYKYPKADEKEQKKIYNFYLTHRQAVNNWDLVDVTTPKVVGAYLLNKDRAILYKYAKSKDLWEKRIAVLATFAFIREGQFDDTLKIAKILLDDTHDLIHKAVGWSLREVGKKDMKLLEEFLKPLYNKMPRTMLRYTIEKFPKEKYQKYLKGQI